MTETWAPQKKEGDYCSQEYKLDATVANQIKKTLWAEHSIADAPDDYSLNEQSDGTTAIITFNSKQIEVDFKAIASRMGLTL